MEIDRTAFLNLKTELEKVEINCKFNKGDNSYYSPIINGFETIQKYEDHLHGLMTSLFDEIKLNQVEIGSKNLYHHYLLELRTEFERLKSLLYDEKDLTDPEVKIYRHSNEFTNDPDIIEGFVSIYNLSSETSKFIVTQKRYIDAIIKFVNRKIRVVENSLSPLENVNIKGIQNLIWNGTDTDLLELITALLERKAFTNSSGNLTRKEAISIFGQIFGRQLKDSESKLSRATDRKKDIAPFLSSLQEAFIKYSESKDNHFNQIR